MVSEIRTLNSVLCSWDDHMLAAIVSASSTFAEGVLTWHLLDDLLVIRIR